MEFNSVQITAFGTVAAVIVAWLAFRQSNKHLRIEQTPYVVVDNIEKKPSLVEISIKNVGRGPALHITCSKSDDPKKRNDAFFRNTQPHSANLSGGDGKETWIVDRNVFDNLSKDDGGFKHFFVFCESQLNTVYRTDVKIKDFNEDRGTNAYVIMENKIEELDYCD